MVTAVKFSDQQTLPCALMNLFVTVWAFGLQAYFRPFANTDANIAEQMTLMSTVLVLILGLAQKSQKQEELDDTLSQSEEAVVDRFLS
eukprot:SAG25_NODE_13899_length_261_cov_0.950617_1_plen_87_part_11